MNANDVDFSNRISRRRRTGYNAESGNWELIGDGDKETSIQKYQRLQCEMKELLEEVNKIQESKDKDNTSCLVSSDQVEQSLKKLADLKLEDALGAEVMAKIADPQGTQIQ